MDRMTHDDYAQHCNAEFGGPAIQAWPTRRTGKLQPRKGGGDPGAAARQQEAERQARIDAATAEINRIFNAPAEGGTPREALYDEQRDTVRQLNTLDVERQAAEAERRNRFALARSGLMGGSVAVDSNADLNRRTNEGLIRAGSIADAAAAELKQADERTRSNLIGMAQSGIDTGSAAKMASEGLRANAQQAAGARGGATIGSLFNDLSQAYLAGQGNMGAGSVTPRSRSDDQWFGVSSPTATYSGSTR